MGTERENNEGKPLNDGCVQVLKYNPFNGNQMMGVLQTMVHVEGKKMGRLNGYKMCSEFGTN